MDESTVEVTPVADGVAVVTTEKAEGETWRTELVTEVKNLCGEMRTALSEVQAARQEDRAFLTSLLESQTVTIREMAGQQTRMAETAMVSSQTPSEVVILETPALLTEEPPLAESESVPSAVAPETATEGSHEVRRKTLRRF